MLLILPSDAPSVQYAEPFPPLSEHQRGRVKEFPRAALYGAAKSIVSLLTNALPVQRNCHEYLLAPLPTNCSKLQLQPPLLDHAEPGKLPVRSFSSWVR